MGVARMTRRAHRPLYSARLVRRLLVLALAWWLPGCEPAPLSASEAVYACVSYVDLSARVGAALAAGWSPDPAGATILAVGPSLVARPISPARAARLEGRAICAERVPDALTVLRLPRRLVVLVTASPSPSERNPLT
jgi:hypothetical protein